MATFLLRTVTALAAAAAMATAVPALAAADDLDATDEAFILELQARGIPVTNESNAVQTGQRICQAMYEGESVSNIHDYISSKTNLNSNQITKVLYISWMYYCPEFA